MTKPALVTFLWVVFGVGSYVVPCAAGDCRGSRSLWIVGVTAPTIHNHCVAIRRYPGTRITVAQSSRTEMAPHGPLPRCRRLSPDPAHTGRRSRRGWTRRG